MNPRHAFFLLIPLALAGCGMEVAGTAATGAAIKQQEIQQGKATQAAVEQQIGAAMQQSEQRQRQLEEAGGK
jgi:hypothetical protein